MKSVLSFFTKTLCVILFAVMMFAVAKTTVQAVSCAGGTCADGWSYGQDCNAPQGSCAQRNSEACASHGGPGSGGGGISCGTNPTQPPTNNNCDSSSTTAQACRGVAPGTNVGPCTCQKTSGSVCACVSNTTCAGSGGSCYSGSTCSSLGRSVANGGAGCSNGVCCGGITSTPTTPAPTPVSTCTTTTYSYYSCSKKIQDKCGVRTIVDGCYNNPATTANECTSGACAAPVATPVGATPSPTPVSATQCFGGTAANGYVDHAILCGSGCPAQQGKVCNPNGTWGTTCVNAHACGWTGTAACTSDADCKVKGYTVPPVACISGVCKNPSGLDFVGCSTSTTWSGSNQSALPNACFNCYKNTAGVISCVRETTSCSAKSTCILTPATPTPGPATCPAGACDIGANPNGGRMCRTGDLACGALGCSTGSVASCSNGSWVCRNDIMCTNTEGVPKTCGSPCKDSVECPSGMYCHNTARVCRDTNYPESTTCTPVVVPPLPSKPPVATPTPNPLCGNGVVNAGEACDMGANNGKDGYACDAFCHLKDTYTCNELCTSDAACNEHVVKLVNRISGTRNTLVVDGITENGVLIQETSPRLFYTSTWTSSTSNTPSGGTYKFTSVEGGAVSFRTTQQNISVRTFRYSTRGIVDVYVDGVLKTSITDLNTGTQGWSDVVIAVHTDALDKFVCQPVGDTRFCRLKANPSSSTCILPTAPPTPNPLVCDLNVRWASTANPDVWKFGDKITFTLDPVPATRIPTGGSVRYEGQVMPYRNGVLVKTINLTPLNASASQFQPMKVDEPGSKYYFRFRYCVKTAAGVETCTAWGNPGTPTGPTPVASPIACATPPVCPAGSNLIYGDPLDGSCPRYQCLPGATPGATPVATKPGSVTPTAPPGCYYQTVQCIQAPCNPILVCPSASPAATKTVKFVNKTLTGRASMVIDAIKEGTPYVQDNDARLVYAGVWAAGTDSSPLGGTYKGTSTNGASVSFATSQSTIYYRTFRHPARSDVQVYVNGVLTITLTGLNSGSGWIDLPIAL